MTGVSSATVSATETAPQRGRPVDHGRRRKSQRHGNRRGIVIHIPAEVLEAAGYAPADDPPYYRLVGHRRSARAGTVLVSLYREP